MTLPLIKKLLEIILPLRSVTREGTVMIIEYIVKRNYAAYQSHRKKQVALAGMLGVQVSL